MRRLLGTVVGPGRDRLQHVVELAREHLGADLVYIAELTDGREVYRTVAGDAASFRVTLDDGPPLGGTYCYALLTGTLPGLIPDAVQDARVADLPITRSRGIGAYAGVPLILDDGSVYGTLCALSHDSDPSLSERDLRFLQMLAELVVDDLTRQRRTAKLRRELSSVIASEAIGIAAQPVVDLRDGACLGVEALARFAEPFTRPDEAFAAAHEVGLGLELERLAARMSLGLLAELTPDQFLSINLSPQVARALSRRVTDGLASPALAMIVLEITEHAAVDSYEQFRDDLNPLRAQGLRIAIDDAGAGYASLHHVVELNPDYIKIDRSLINGVGDDRARRVAVSAFVSLALDLNATVIAEGVETRHDLDVIRDLGVGAAQGYLLARPSSDRTDIRHWSREGLGDWRSVSTPTPSQP